MFSIKEIKARAMEAFKANYWKCVLVSVISMFVLAAGSSGGGAGNTGESKDVSGAIDSITSAIDNMTPKQFSVMAALITGILGMAVVISILINVFVRNIFEVGFARFFTVNQRTHEAAIPEVFYGFSNGYMRNAVTMFFRDLYIFLWTMLFVIPGIVKAYEYRMLPYILSENPDMSRQEAFALSKELMTGNKFRAFLLDFSFIGWALLSICTLGILNIFWTSPYFMSAGAELYVTLLNNSGRYYGQRTEYEVKDTVEF